MYAPPPFVPPAKKNNNTVLIVVLVILGVLGLCCVGGFFLVLNFFNKFKGMIACTLNYENTLQAINRYVSDKKHYPPAAGWQDEIAPYWQATAKDRQAAKMFSASEPSQDLGCRGDDSGPATGMAYNTAIAGKTPEKVPSRSTVVLFEVPTTGRNQALAYKVRTDNSPQRILGRPRPWLSITADGMLSNSTRTSTWDIDTKSDNRSDAPPNLAKDSETGDKTGAEGSGKSTSN
jgi:hypothetical protein